MHDRLHVTDDRSADVYNLAGIWSGRQQGGAGDSGAGRQWQRAAADAAGSRGHSRRAGHRSLLWKQPQQRPVGQQFVPDNQSGVMTCCFWGCCVLGQACSWSVLGRVCAVNCGYVFGQECSWSAL